MIVIFRENFNLYKPNILASTLLFFKDFAYCHSILAKFLLVNSPLRLI